MSYCQFTWDLTYFCLVGNFSLNPHSVALPTIINVFTYIYQEIKQEAKKHRRRNRCLVISFQGFFQPVDKIGDYWLNCQITSFPGGLLD